MHNFIKLMALCTLAACSYDLTALQGTGDGGSADGGADTLLLIDTHADTALIGIPFVTGGAGGTVILPGTGGMVATGGMVGAGGAPPATGGSGGMSEARPNGAACGLPAQCTSNHCLGDPGRCCNTACNGPGESCTTGFCEVTDPIVRPVAYNGHQYIFATTGAIADYIAGVGSGYWRSWDAARVWCQQYGYDLVSIDDATENAWLATTLLQYATPTVEQLWIGLTNKATGDQWVDVNGAAAPFLNWAAGQPDNNSDYGKNPDGEHCAGFVQKASVTMPVVGTWNDRRCRNPSAFVCESL